MHVVCQAHQSAQTTAPSRLSPGEQVVGPYPSYFSVVLCFSILTCRNISNFRCSRHTSMGIPRVVRGTRWVGIPRVGTCMQVMVVVGDWVHLTSPHLTPPHLTSRTSPHAPHLTSCPSPHLTRQNSSLVVVTGNVLMKFVNRNPAAS